MTICLDLSNVKGLKSLTMSSPAFLTVTQAADELDITRQAIQLMIKEKRISAEWMLERWAIPISEVARIKRERKQQQEKAA